VETGNIRLLPRHTVKWDLENIEGSGVST
jgi:hypothetical protein